MQVIETTDKNTTGIIDFDITTCTVPLVLNPNYIFKGNLKVPGTSLRSAKQIAAQIHLTQNSHNNTLSEKARKNIAFALNWLYSSAKTKYVWSEKHRKTFSFKVNFITLTIPSKTGIIVARTLVEEKISENGRLVENPLFSQIIEDDRKNVVDEKVFQTCINSFLTYMRKYHKLGNYVWKVEAQINGQLHIHLSTDQYIKYQDINFVWNRILQKHGLLDLFFNKHQHYNAPTSDVHSTKQMYNAIAYISGYMKKNPNFCKTYSGRIWGCSSGLSPKNKLTMQASFQDWKEMRKEILNSGFQWNECIVKDKSGTPVASAGYIFYLKKNQCFNIVHPKIKEQYLKHREFIQSKTTKQKSEYMVVDLFGEKQFITTASPPDIPVIESNQDLIIIPNQMSIFDAELF